MVLKILRDEQLTMMQLATATTASDAHEHRNELGRLAGKLSLFSSYPHRPYVEGQARAPATSAAREAPKSAS